jgi:hypothetical protein
MRRSLDFSKINGAGHPHAVQQRTCWKAQRHSVGFVGVPAQDVFHELDLIVWLRGEQNRRQRRHLAKLLRPGR